MIGLVSLAALAAPDRSAPPAVAEPTLLVYPEPTVIPLGSGVVAWHIEVPGSRKDAVQVVWRRGAADLAADQPLALGQAVGALADRAGGSWSATELSTWTDLHQVTLWSAVGQHEMEVAFTAPPDAMEGAFARAGALIHDAWFPPSELDQWATDQQLFYASTGPASAGTVGSLALSYSWFPAEHPYGKRPDLRALGALRPRDLREAWARWTTDAPVVVLVAGRPWAAFEPLMGALVAGIGRDTPAAKALAVPPPELTRFVGVNLPNQDQVTLLCRLAAPADTDADLAAMRVANLVLGGLFGGRLNTNLREEKGLTYGVNSSYRRDATWGTVTVEVDLASGRVQEGVTEIERELVRLSAEPPSEAELEAARRAVAADWNRSFENAERAIELYREALYTGLTVAGLQERVRGVQRVTRADVARVAGEWLGPAAARVWVVAGSRELVEPELARIGVVAEWSAPVPAILGRF